MPDHAIQHYYGVLIRISTGYPPVKGRLHTRYSPVRRSLSIATIPLDLHVLSLPLAFILSQDQTLRCIENFKYYSVLTRLSELILTSFTAYLFRSFVFFPSQISSMNSSVRMLNFCSLYTRFFW